ncbi:hypothetical protein QTV43_000614 [Vibrio vulnificus]|nr:hypothetical protein [Vibrio vulnificus]
MHQDMKQIEEMLSTLENALGKKANYWYGFRLRGLSIGCQPDNHVAYLTPEETSIKFASLELEESRIRFGAVAYEKPLTEELIEHFSLTDLNYEPEALDTEYCEGVIRRLVCDWMYDNDIKGLAGGALNEPLKKLKSAATVKTGLIAAFGRQFRNLDEFLERKEEPKRYKRLESQLSQLTIEMIEEFISQI